MSTGIRASSTLLDVYNEKSSPNVTMSDRRLREETNTGGPNVYATRRGTPASSPGKFIISGVTSPEDVSQSGRLTLERLRQVITNLRNDLDRANQLNKLYRQTLQSHGIDVPTMNDVLPASPSVKASSCARESGVLASDIDHAVPKLQLALDTSTSPSRNSSSQVHTPTGQTIPSFAVSDRSQSPSSPHIPSRSSHRPAPTDLSDSIGQLSLSVPVLAPPSRTAPEIPNEQDDQASRTNTKDPLIASESETPAVLKIKSPSLNQRVPSEIDVKTAISPVQTEPTKSITDEEAGSSSQFEHINTSSASVASLSSASAYSSKMEPSFSQDDLKESPTGGMDASFKSTNDDGIYQTVLTNPFPSPSERNSINFSARLPAFTKTQSPVSTHYSVEDQHIEPNSEYQAVTSDRRIEPLKDGIETPVISRTEITLDVITPTDTGGNDTQESSFSNYHDARALPADDNFGGPVLDVSPEGSFEEEFDLAVSQLKPNTTPNIYGDSAPPRSSEFANSAESLSLASTSASSPVRDAKAVSDAEEISQTSPSRQQRPVTSPLLVEPDSLPLVTVHVSSTLEKLSHKSTYKASNTVILISVYDRESGKRLWRVRKSPNEFTEFNDKVRRFLSGHSLAKLPDKSLFASNSPSKVSKRNGMLEDYLTSVTSIPGLPAPAAYMLCQFLSLGLVNPLDDIPDDEQEIKIRGFLTKKTKSFGTWKSRYFVLKNSVLYYYDSPGENAVGYLQIEGARIELPPQRHAHDDIHYHGGTTTLNFGNDYRHSFIVMEKKKKSSRYVRHVFCAENEDDRSEWIKALREVDGVEFVDHNSRLTLEQSDSASVTGLASQGYNEPISESSLSLVSSMSSPRKNVKSMLGESNSSTIYGANNGDSHNHEPGATNNSFRASLIATSDMKIMNANLKKLRKRNIFSFRHRHSRSSDLSATTTESTTSGAPYGSADGSASKERITSNLDSGLEAFSLPRDDSFGVSMNTYGDELVFGRPISESIEYSSKDCDAGILPAVVYRCIEYLDSKSAILTEGIFRMSGSSTAIRTLRERFDTQHDVNLLSVTDVNFDQHTVAGLLKLYFRSLPIPLIGPEALADLMKCLEMTDLDLQVTTIRRIVETLPVENFTVLRFLMRYLLEVVHYSDTNKMTLRNIAIVFSPTLNVPVRIISLWLTKMYSIFDPPNDSNAS